MRIAIISETFLPKVDGITNTLCRLLEHLDRRGHSSLMFAPQGAPSVYAHTPILQPLSIPFPLYPELKIANPFTNFERYLTEFQPELIHVVNPFVLGLAGTHYARVNNIPLVASYHTDIPGYSSKYGLPFMEDLLWDYFRWIHNKADLNLCPSLFTLRELENQGFINLKLWSRGVDIERFAPSKCSRNWRWQLTNGKPESMILLFVGRLAPEKRVDWLLPMIQSMPYAHLVIVGDGPLREDLQLMFKGTNTTFTGYLHGEDLAQVYASSDIFVFPSANETFGNVVLEAMASALPVVAPNSGGVIDSVMNHQTGILFNPDSQADFMDAVTEIATNPDKLWQMGSHARAEASKRRWSEVLDNLIADYELAINKHHHFKLAQQTISASHKLHLPSWLE